MSYLFVCWLTSQGSTEDSVKYYNSTVTMSIELLHSKWKSIQSESYEKYMRLECMSNGCVCERAGWAFIPSGTQVQGKAETKRDIQITMNILFHTKCESKKSLKLLKQFKMRNPLACLLLTVYTLADAGFRSADERAFSQIFLPRKYCISWFLSCL